MPHLDALIMSSQRKGYQAPLTGEQRGTTAALELLRQRARREAQTQTFADAFLAIMVCLMIATVMVPLMRKVVLPKAPPAESH